jgi:hypothetical protein
MTRQTPETTTDGARGPGAPGAEPRVVVAHREHLWWLLAEAAQLEHMIMCQYLFAELSLKDEGDPSLTAEQSAAVERWRGVLRGIAVEEMLHFALVGNLMAGIGAAPVLSRPNFPQRSGYFPAGVQLDLLPFGDQALLHFLFLERPEGLERPDASEFVPDAPPRDPVVESEWLPRGQEFATVGHLYRGVAEGLRTLCARDGEAAVFIGNPRGQATPELFSWPQIVPVTDLASGLAAVEEIIEQGEGAQGNWSHAHYGRFLGIWEEYQQLRQADPAFEPARPVQAAFLRQPYDIRVPCPLITDPQAREVGELAVLAYEVTLQVLLRFFTHTEETDEQLKVLVDSALTLMARVLRPLASALTTLPVGPEHPGRTAGFAFEMYYALTGAMPDRAAAWAILHERAEILARRCAELAATDADLPATVRQAGEQAAPVAAKLRAHVPEALLPPR